MRLYTYIVVALCMVSGLTCASEPIRNRALGRIDLQGHRGARGLLPENTLPSFQAAYDYKMTTIELDTTLTRDHQLIVHHNTKLNPDLCVHGDGRPIEEETPIIDVTVDALKQLDCGLLKNERFPRQRPIPNTRLVTLPEVFSYFKEMEKKKPRKVRLNIEAKFNIKDGYTKEQVEITARVMHEVIKQAGWERRVIVQSFALDYLEEFSRLDNNILISALFEPSNWEGARMYLGMGDGIRNSIIDRTLELKANVISPYKLYVTPQFVQRCHENGLRVVPWTVNKRADMARLLDIGVDGIISDYPKKLRSEYKKFLKRRQKAS